MTDPIFELSGNQLSVWWADEDSKESLNKALSHCQASKRNSVERALDILLKKLANEIRGTRTGLTGGSFPEEGDLPSKPGGTGGKYYAIKKKPVRIYGWFMQRNDHPTIKKSDFIISHCVYKDYERKKAVEDGRIKVKWNKVEEECDDNHSRKNPRAR